MARCNDCNKFVAYGDAELESNLECEVDSSDAKVVHITGDIEMTLPCEQCGSALRTTTFSVDEDVSFDVEVESPEMNDDPESSQRTEGTGRGTKTFYGYVLSGTVTATKKGSEEDAKDTEVTADFNISDDCQASSLDEC